MSTETDTEGGAGAESDAGAAAGAEEAHDNAEQEVVAVDAEDNEQGIVNRLEAHTGDGTRHRAFTVLVFDDSGTRTGTVPSPRIPTRVRPRRTPPASASPRSSGSRSRSTATSG